MLPSRGSGTTWSREFAKCFKKNWPNWAALFVVLLTYAIVEGTATPFVRHLTPQDWESLKYPYSSHSSVPSAWVPVYGFVFPILFAILYHVFTRSEMREFHDLLFAAIFTPSVCALATTALKLSLGRPRPNYFERCYKDTYNVTAELPFDAFDPPGCTNTDEDVVEDGRKSFPSGHSSMAMCSMFFMTLFLIGKFRVFAGQADGWKLLVSFLPTCAAIGIGITRINDYVHHWTDVLTGFLLGMAIASAVYLMYYPWPFSRGDTATPLYKSFPEREGYGRAQLELEPEEAMEEGNQHVAMTSMRLGQLPCEPTNLF